VSSQSFVSEVQGLREVPIRTPSAGDGGLLGREIWRWATPLGLIYAGAGLILVSLRSRKAERGGAPGSITPKKGGG
jgi:hypothetical protein